MEKFLVIHMVKNKEGFATNKVCGVFNTKQDAEAYQDKYDRRMLDSYMVIATLQLDEKGRFVPQSFEYNEDEPTNEETLLRIYGIEEVPLEEAVCIPQKEITAEEEILKEDPNGIKDEMKELK